MINNTDRNTHTINLREQTEKNNIGLCLPAMPPVGLSRAIGQWLRGRRRHHGAADPTRLNSHLKADIGINTRDDHRLGERELTRIYSQPLGQIRLSRQSGAPAEQHRTIGRRVQDTRH